MNNGNLFSKMNLSSSFTSFLVLGYQHKHVGLIFQHFAIACCIEHYNNNYDKDNRYCTK